MPGSFLYRSRAMSVGLLLLLLFLCTGRAQAQFPINPAVNVPIARAADAQTDPVIVSDGAGGAFIAWVDLRSGQGMDVYAQHLDASGRALWDSNGTIVCGEPGIQATLGIVSDSAGGAIIVWEDKRTDENYDIYAQRVNSSGTALWSAGGTSVAVTDGDQQSPAIVADGNGGAIVVWCDTRSGGSSGIYAQRLNAAGNALWAQHGVPVLRADVSSTFIVPALASDGDQGAIVGWEDSRNGQQRDIRAQRIDGSGASLWDTASVVLSKEPSDQYGVVLAGDGSGGAIACWTDLRTQSNTGTFGDVGIYAQRIDASGTVRWTQDGITVNDTTSSQESSVIVGDGRGGAIISWVDYRRGDYDLYAQKVDSTGAVRWSPSGVVICDADGDQNLLRIIGDGSGGAFVSWSDVRSGDQDIYAQRVSASGSLLWASNGIAVSSASQTQISGGMASVGPRGVIVTWTDGRGMDSDVYAQNVDPWGYLGLAPTPLLPAHGAGVNGDMVSLSWTRVLPAASRYWLEVAPDSLFTFRSTDSTITDTVHVVTNLTTAQTYWWRVRGYDNGWGPFSTARSFSIQTGVAVDENRPDVPRVFALEQNYPNPFNPTTVISSQLPAASEMRLAVYDLLGREVAVLVNERRAAGKYQDSFDAQGLASGVYVYRLSAGSFSASRQMTLIK